MRAIAHSLSVATSLATSVAAVLWVAPVRAAEPHLASTEPAESISLDTLKRSDLVPAAEEPASAELRETSKFSSGMFQSDVIQSEPIQVNALQPGTLQLIQVPALTAAAQLSSDVPTEPPVLEPLPLAAQGLREAERADASELAQDSLDSPESGVEPVDLPELEPAELPEGDVDPVDPVEALPADPEISGQPRPSAPWRFSLEPYFFVPFDINVDLTAAGRSTSVEAGLDDVLNLDRAFDAGLRFEAQRGRLGFLLEGFYLVAGNSGTLGVTFPEGSLTRFGIPIEVRGEADASATVRRGKIDLAAFYTVVNTSLRRSPTPTNPFPVLVIEPVLGLRTNFSRQELEIEEARLGPNVVLRDQEFSSSRTTLEPLVGIRIGTALSRLWSLGFRGDVSGFNINAERDITWNLQFGVSYALSQSASIKLAYVLNGSDLRDGEGLRRTELELVQSGLGLSVMFRF